MNNIRPKKSRMVGSNGIFQGIKVGNETISIEQWNKDTSGEMSVEEFKSQYQNYYNELFGEK